MTEQIPSWLTITPEAAQEAAQRISGQLVSVATESLLQKRSPELEIRKLDKRFQLVNKPRRIVDNLTGEIIE